MPMFLVHDFKVVQIIKNNLNIIIVYIFALCNFLCILLSIAMFSWMQKNNNNNKKKKENDLGENNLRVTIIIKAAVLFLALY